MQYYIYSVGIQIHFTGQAHWVTSAYNGGQFDYDSCVTALMKSLNAQLKQIYRGKVEKNGSLIINEMSVQQQENSYDCGLFAIAFAFHLAQGDEPSALNFDCKKLRQHLVECFEKEVLSPFPMLVKDLLAVPNKSEILLSTINSTKLI